MIKLRGVYTSYHMSERYEPKSDFLNSVIAKEAPLTGEPFGEANLRLLIEMTRDPDPSNRDWATFLLGQAKVDTTETREALIRVAREDEGIVQAEAVRALASRDPLLALPFVKAGLRAESVWMPMFEAAELCAHPSLIEDLRGWAEPSDDPLADRVAASALNACELAASRSS